MQPTDFDKQLVEAIQYFQCNAYGVVWMRSMDYDSRVRACAPDGTKENDKMDGGSKEADEEQSRGAGRMQK